MNPISIVEHTEFTNLVTRVVIEHEGKYLLVEEGKEHVKGLWAFPGGKLDVGEFLSVAAEREIYEETGVEINLTGLLGVQFVLWNDLPGLTLEIVFLAEAVKIPHAFPTSKEILSVGWKTLVEIEQLCEAKLMRNSGQVAIYELIKAGHVLPLSALREVSAPSPKL